MKVERVIAVIDGKHYELKKDVSCFRCALRVDCCQFYGYRKIKEAKK